MSYRAPLKRFWVDIRQVWSLFLVATIRKLLDLLPIPIVFSAELLLRSVFKLLQVRIFAKYPHYGNIFLNRLLGGNHLEAHR